MDYYNKVCSVLFDLVRVLSNSLQVELDASARLDSSASAHIFLWFNRTLLASLSKATYRPTRAPRDSIDLQLGPVDLFKALETTRPAAPAYGPCSSSLAACRLHRIRPPPRPRRSLHPTPLTVSHRQPTLPLQHRNEQTRSPHSPRSSPRARAPLPSKATRLYPISATLSAADSSPLGPQVQGMSRQVD